MGVRASPDTLFDKRLAALVRHLPGALDGDVEALHQARVASRRLREALPILCAAAPRTRPGKTGQKVREITRTLGGVRELDVALLLLDEIDRSDPARRNVIDRLRQRTIGERDATRKRMLGRLKRLNLNKLLRELKGVARALGENGSGAAWRSELTDRVRRRAQRLRAAIGSAGTLYLPDRLHRVRVAMKKLRYAVELSGEATVARTSGALKTLKRAQDTLGRLHDLELLLGQARRTLADESGERGELDTVARGLEQECRELHGRYVAGRTSLEQVCEAMAGVTRVNRRRRTRLGSSRRPAPPAARFVENAHGRGR